MLLRSLALAVAESPLSAPVLVVMLTRSLCAAPTTNMMTFLAGTCRSSSHRNYHVNAWTVCQARYDPFYEYLSFQFLSLAKPFLSLLFLHS
ncbi:uncharacterized protein EDB91DRAFT_1139069 [Suillus paluster]|uniref:uncharacterized protein n=1 Tax=Suillus paluster TaxID=48578 RepID=UPI001B87D196|nr:uncharacterized protein EDB91DRAFT_1139069 [Suillus paluster]KAG1738119.1 hypothetical protein EDB91DRAFT_1139069 [Suillus paluster]